MFHVGDIVVNKSTNDTMKIIGKGIDDVFFVLETPDGDIHRISWIAAMNSFEKLEEEN